MVALQKVAPFVRKRVRIALEPGQHVMASFVGNCCQKRLFFVKVPCSVAILSKFSQRMLRGFRPPPCKPHAAAKPKGETAMRAHLMGRSAASRSRLGSTTGLPDRAGFRRLPLRL